MFFIIFFELFCGQPVLGVIFFVTNLIINKEILLSSMHFNQLFKYFILL